MRNIPIALAILTFFASTAGAEGPPQAAPASTSPPVEQASGIASSPGPDQAPIELAALEGEPVLIERLNGLVFVADEADLQTQPTVDASGIDATRAPLLTGQPVAETMALFLGRPQSAASLDRLQLVVRRLLEGGGHPFTVVYLPEQDVTAGIVQVVAREAVLDAITVENARWFSEGSYAGALRLRPGGTIDLDTLQSDVAWLNRHPFRQVTPLAQPGAAPGTTTLVLQAADRVPFKPFAGYDNTGTRLTGASRVVAGLTWGNVFGLGHLVTYQVRADPEFNRSTSHALNYEAHLPWRHLLTIYGAYAQLNPSLAPPFDQAGRTWQTGLQYGIPLPGGGRAIDHRLGIALDFKASDNTLEFSDFPVVDNETHVAQVGVNYGVTLRDARGQTALSAGVYHSPGGLSGRNGDEAFRIARAGARANYSYGRLTVGRQMRLAPRLQWTGSANLQVSNRNLLGSEQVVAGGAGSVRGYDEGFAYGDNGLVATNTLSVPVWQRGTQNMAVELFHDVARVWSVDRLPNEPRARVLQSAGAGIGYALGSNVVLQVHYGFRLSERQTPAGRSERGRVHVRMQASY